MQPQERIKAMNNKYLHTNTLLGYFKHNILNNGCSIKYFNKAFLNEYIKAYNARKANIENEIYNEYGSNKYEYNKVFETDFYNKNSSAYCVFCELWQGYKQASKNIDGGCNRSEWEKIAVQTANYLHDMQTISKYRYD